MSTEALVKPPQLEARVVARAGELRLDAELRAEAGETVAVLGPNGAGKTSFLRALAGILPLEEGFVRFGGDVHEDAAAGARLPPERRGIGWVFQDARLFPHMSVLENVAFGPRARGVARRDARERAREWLRKLGIDSLAERDTPNLSGGEAQRVALARALAAEPRLLLLDEPLSALDARARAELRRDLARILGSFAGVCLLVSHEPMDALTLARRLVVLEGGRVVQTGTAEEVAIRPRSEWIARFVGVNLFRGIASSGTIVLAGGARLVAVDGEGEVFAVVAPRAVSLHLVHPGGTPRNVWDGVVDGIEASGERCRVGFRGEVSLVSEVTRRAVDELALRPGARVFASVKATEVAVYPA